MIGVYVLTILIVGSWLLKMIRSKKIIFTRTFLDIPLVIFLISQLLSTIFSIDAHTSIFGYYGRFNGGLLSSICYILLYFAFVSNVNKKNFKYIFTSIFVSGAIVALWAIMEHFGYSISCLLVDGKLYDGCWVQDVQQRVFATLGQPNWLAAYMSILTPIALMETFESFSDSKHKFDLEKLIANKKVLIYLFLTIIYTATVWFTKSKSGLLGLALSLGILTAGFAWRKSRKLFSGLVAVGILVTLAAIVLKGPALAQLINGDVEQNTTGGTDSGIIRSLVWEGAIETFKHYPILGGGLETFAYTFPAYRPAAHNLTSEWDFIYNKAHNEYLNVLVNSGVAGFGAYLIFIIFGVVQMMKGKNSLFKFALLGSYVSILITNFFGFSVVVTQIFLFLLPAIAVVMQSKEKEEKKNNLDLDGLQKILLGGVIVLSVFLIYLTGRYWWTDYLYAKGGSSVNDLVKAVEMSPNEPVYLDSLGRTLGQYAIALQDKKEDKEQVAQLGQKADEESKQAIQLSYYNVPLRKNRIRLLLTLADIPNSSYLAEVIPFIEETKEMDTNDPFIYAEEGKAYVKLNMVDDAIPFYEKAVSLKTNYQDARFALGILYKVKKEKEKARQQFQYILDNLSPNDSLVKEQLKSL